MSKNENESNSAGGHAPRSVERECDVLVVGGGPAGLAAALQLAHQHRSVIVVDAGEPRNAPAARMYGYLGLDGTPPREMVELGRADVRRYGAEVLDGRVVDITEVESGFRAGLTGGNAVRARKVVLATGLVDVLPDIDGVAEQWGSGVIHCPFCHGYGVRDQQLVLIATHRMGLHPASLFAHLTDRLTVVVPEPDKVDGDELDALRSAGVTVVDKRVERLIVDDGVLRGVAVAGGGVLDADAVVVVPTFRVNTDGFGGLGVEVADHPAGIGDHVVADQMGATSVTGVYAVGNVTDASQQVLHAAAHGSKVGAMVAFALASEDLGGRERRSFNEADWDRRYGGDQIWSGNPNGTLVNEVESLAPGRALDVGAGEGGDAIWLANQGWKVTATDVSGRALAGVEAEAVRQGLAVEVHHVDANTPRAFAAVGQFDLVSSFYPAIPRTADDRALHNVLDAVAPGGTLLVVHHDMTPMRAPIDTREHSRMFDPGGFVSVDDFALAVTAEPGWTIEVHATRPRPAGAASGAHHVDDVVLRARRSTEAAA